MEEVIARLAAIESRLDSLERVVDDRYERCEGANQRRCDDIDRVSRELDRGLSDVRYDIDRVRNDLSRSGARGW